MNVRSLFVSLDAIAPAEFWVFEPARHSHVDVSHRQEQQDDQRRDRVCDAHVAVRHPEGRMKVGESANIAWSIRTKRAAWRSSRWVRFSGLRRQRAAWADWEWCSRWLKRARVRKGLVKAASRRTNEDVGDDQRDEDVLHRAVGPGVVGQPGVLHGEAHADVEEHGRAAENHGDGQHGGRRAFVRVGGAFECTPLCWLLHSRKKSHPQRCRESWITSRRVCRDWRASPTSLTGINEISHESTEQQLVRTEFRQCLHHQSFHVSFGRRFTRRCSSGI